METKCSVQFGDVTYEAELRRRNDWRARPRKTRAYVFGPGDDRNPSKEFRFLAEHIGAPSVYTRRGEWPALDKAFDVMNREIVAAKREVLDAVLEKMDLGVEKIQFSKKAGCSCGCSPGFIIDGPWNQELYISREKAA